MEKLKVNTIESEYGKVSEFVNNFLAHDKYVASDRLWIQLLVEELFKLKCTSGHAKEMVLTLNRSKTPTDMVVAYIESEGDPYIHFGGLSNIPKDSPLAAGLLIINHAADNFSYEYKNGKNILKINRRIRKEGEK